ncbi:2-C-methyl-D-erythritol 2,4-cyclodiphosphate synthase, partial [Bartonella sp. MR168JLCBS]
ILSLSLDRISIKATTNEELGFIGREEGIAALATATVLYPGEIPK